MSKKRRKYSLPDDPSFVKRPGEPIPPPIIVPPPKNLPWMPTTEKPESEPVLPLLSIIKTCKPLRKDIKKDIFGMRNGFIGLIIFSIIIILVFLYIIIV